MKKLQGLGILAGATVLACAAPPVGDSGGVGDASVEVLDAVAACDPNYDAFDDIWWIAAVVDGDAVDVWVRVVSGNYTGDFTLEYDPGSQQWLGSIWADDLDSDCDTATSTSWEFFADARDGTQDSHTVSGSHY